MHRPCQHIVEIQVPIYDVINKVVVHTEHDLVYEPRQLRLLVDVRKWHLNFTKRKTYLEESETPVRRTFGLY